MKIDYGITYLYNAESNIVNKSDASHPEKFNNSQSVKPEGIYLYDPLCLGRWLQQQLKCICRPLVRSLNGAGLRT